MALGKLIAMADEASELADAGGEVTEEAYDNGASGGLLGDLSSNFRILIMVGVAVILFFVMRELYAVLINREWHPANAKLLTFSIFFTLLCAIFTVLFVGLGQALNIVIIILWAVLVIYIVFALIKRRR